MLYSGSHCKHHIPLDGCGLLIVCTLYGWSWQLIRYNLATLRAVRRLRNVSFSRTKAKPNAGKQGVLNSLKVLETDQRPSPTSPYAYLFWVVRQTFLQPLRVRTIPLLQMNIELTESHVDRIASVLYLSVIFLSADSRSSAAYKPTTWYRLLWELQWLPWLTYLVHSLRGLSLQSRRNGRPLS